MKGAGRAGGTEIASGDGLGVVVAVAGKAESPQEWERHNLERRPKLQRRRKKSAPDSLVMLGERELSVDGQKGHPTSDGATVDD